MAFSISIERRAALVVATIFLLMASPLNAQAQLYKCTDANGKVTYQETLCSANKEEGKLRIKEQDSLPGREGSTTSGGNVGAKAAGAEALKAKLIEVLKDPESARFRNLKVVEFGQVLCGEVNAKNAFGGYVGFKPFVVDGQGVYLAQSNQRYDANLLDYLAWEKKAKHYGCS